MREQTERKPAVPRLNRRRFIATAGAVLLASGLIVPAQAQKEVYTVMAAGDIACSMLDSHFNEGKGVGSYCRMADTATLIVRENPDLVLAPGDLAYEKGTNQEFSESYDRFWGAFKKKTLAVPGNHEYYGNTSTARGFSDAFGIPHEQRGRLFFSKDIGEYWHLVGLNSSRMSELRINPDLEQLNWLERDLEANRGKHVLAMWHHPRFAGVSGTDDLTKGFWDILYEAGAKVVLNGHDHSYKRTAKVDPDGNPDPIKGIRQFTVGTGGKSLYPSENVPSIVERFQFTDPGVLKLVLGRGFYSWDFISIFGKESFRDYGVELLPPA